MRETLSERSRTTSKPMPKAQVRTKLTNNRAQSKLHPASKSKSVSPSKPKASATAKSKTAALKPVKSAKKAVVTKKTVAKKDAAKLGKPVLKKNAAAKKVTKRMASSPKAAVKQPKTAAKATKVKAPLKAKMPLKAAVIAKPVVRKAQSGKLSATRPNKVVMPINVAPPVPEPPRKLTPSGAMRAFEHAVRVFNRRMFEDAKTMFEHLLEKFPREVEIAARTQMYLQVCNQKLAHSPSIPRNADDLYDHGVYALNLGDFSQAKNFFEKALRMKPDEPHLLYSLAATHAQTGSHDQALDYLKRTIQLQPRYRTQALNDTDFTELRENKQFLELVGLASPFDLLQSRR